MMDVVLDVLNKNNIKDYLVLDENRESVELFLIKRKIDLIRSKNVREIKVCVYRDFEKYRGSSTVYIYPGMDYAEIEKVILAGYESAQNVKNPYFALPSGIKAAGDTNAANLKEYALSMSKSLYLGEEEVSGAFINSSEFFAKRSRVHIMSSEGTDVTYDKSCVSGEFVVQCVTADEDVELYQDFEYEGPSTDNIREKAVNALNMVKDRAKAVKAPADLSEYPIIIADGYVGELLKFYLNRSNASYIYPGYSSYCKGYKVMDGKNGELISINGVPKKPFSDEGVPMVKRPIITDGVVENIHGNVAFLSYIKGEQTGEYECIECTNGKMEMDSLLKGKYIMVKNFSDFQVDAYDGHFGGEFRLAYLSDGEKVSILTGGTVSGNLTKDGDKMIFSKERYKDAYYDGPAAVKIVAT